MKNLLYSLLLAIALLSTANLSAQYDGAREAISVRYLLPNYTFPFNNDFRWSDFDKGLEFEYARHLNPWLNFTVPLKIAEVRYPLDATGTVFQEDGVYLGLDALLQLKYFRPTNFVNPSLFTGLGFNYENTEKGSLALPIGVMLDWKLGNNFYLSTKGEYRVGFDDNRDNLQLAAGLKLLLGQGNTPAPVKPADRDGDGVVDSEDLCPDQAGTLATNGCPDSDGDGVVDSKDDCPMVAGTLNGCPDTDKDGIADKDDNCPTEAGPAANQGCPIRDADGDGIPDAQDACPNDAGPVATGGCPDRDGDGIADKDDKCPDDRGTVATGGCPDRDNDGIIDSADRCPDSAGPASNNGCPEIKQEDKEILTFAMKVVQFETASATLKQESYAILDQIVDILNRYRDYSLRINGHTDSIGSSAPNQVLSEKRAKACYDYLASKGISASRMSFKGFGESQPIADNRYKAGRDQNRRVEFDIYLPGN